MEGRNYGACEDGNIFSISLSKLNYLLSGRFNTTDQCFNPDPH